MTRTTLLGFLLLAAAVSAAASERPNILFALADDWSSGHAGAYGCAWLKTPAFDRIAREGILFTRAYTPNAKCAPSRSCILTGRNPWQLEAACNHVSYFPVKFKTYTEALAEHGYFAGMTTKGWGPGVATNAAGGPRAMVGRRFDRRTLKPPAEGIGNSDYAANFADFLDAAPAGQPWCFWYGSIEPHRGYEQGSGVAKGGKSTAQVNRVPECWPDNEVVRSDLLDYAFEIEHFDRHLGRMLDELARRGQLSNTLVVVTADNGMPFPRAKGQAYEAGVHLPLACMWPAGIRQAGRVVDDYVSFIDYAPTFLAVAGLDREKAGMAPFAGRSLVEIFASDRAGRVIDARDHVLLGQERHDVGRPHDWGYPIRGIVKDGMMYLHNFETNRWPAGNPETGYLNTDAGATKSHILAARRENPGDAHWALCFGKRGPEELFDLKADPDCVRNLAVDAAHASARDALREQLFRELRAQEDPRMDGRGEVFEREPYAGARDRGFYERYMGGEKYVPGWVIATDFEKAPLD